MTKSLKAFKMMLQPLLSKRAQERALKTARVCHPDGDCFVRAGKNILDGRLPAQHTKLVHAIVQGQGKSKGQRLHHAWNEIGDVVIDNSAGRNIIMRKEHYYKLGKVQQKPGKYASYTDEEMYKKVAKHQHWGPWDLDE